MRRFSLLCVFVMFLGVGAAVADEQSLVLVVQKPVAVEDFAGCLQASSSWPTSAERTLSKATSLPLADSRAPAPTSQWSPPPSRAMRSFW